MRTARLRWMDAAGIDVQFVCATPVHVRLRVGRAAPPRGATRMNDRVLEFCARRSAAAQGARASAAAGHRRRMPRGRRARSVGPYRRADRQPRRRERPRRSGILDFLRHCASESMPVLVHPWDMMGDERMKRWMLPWLVAMPAETQLVHPVADPVRRVRAAAALADLVFAHGGGSFVWLARPRRQRVAAARHRARRLPAAAVVLLRPLLRGLGDLRRRCAAAAGRARWEPIACCSAPMRRFRWASRKPGALVESTFGDEPQVRDAILHGTPSAFSASPSEDRSGAAPAAKVRAIDAARRERACIRPARRSRRC